MGFACLLEGLIMEGATFSQRPSKDKCIDTGKISYVNGFQFVFQHNNDPFLLSCDMYGCGMYETLYCCIKGRR